MNLKCENYELLLSQHINLSESIILYVNYNNNSFINLSKQCKYFYIIESNIKKMSKLKIFKKNYSLHNVDLILGYLYNVLLYNNFDILILNINYLLYKNDLNFELQFIKKQYKKKLFLINITNFKKEHLNDILKTIKSKFKKKIIYELCNYYKYIILIKL